MFLVLLALKFCAIHVGKEGHCFSQADLNSEKFPLVCRFSLKCCGLLNHFKHHQLPLSSAENVRLYSWLPAAGRLLFIDCAGPLSVLRFVSLSSEVHFS